MSTLQEKAEHLMLGCNAMGWHASAALVKDLLQQRTELLESLKKCRFDSLNMSLEDWRFVQEAITKAEAAE